MKNSLVGLIYAPMKPGEYLTGLTVGIISWLFGDLAYGVGVLIFLTVIDFITGLLKAGSDGAVESTKMARTGYKLAGYVVLIAALNLFFGGYLPTVPGLEPETKLIGPGLLFFFNLVPHFVTMVLNLREINSIVENLAQAGLIPKGMATWLGKIFVRVREFTEKDTGLKDLKDK